MKLINVLRSLGRDLPPLVEGQVVGVDDRLADQLAALNLAVILGDVPDQEIELRAPEPEQSPAIVEPVENTESKIVRKKRKTR